MTSAWRTWREDAGGVGVLLALAAGAYFLVLVPRQSTHEQAQTIRDQTDLVLSQVAMVGTQRRMAEQELGAVATGTGDDAPLRPASEFNQLLARLNDAAVRSEITLDKILPGTTEHTRELTRRRISLAGQGSYPACVTLLRTIRDEFPDVVVVAVSATRGGPDTSGRAMVSLELAWHAQPSPPANPPPQ